MAGRSICARPAKGACAGCASTESISISCTPSIPHVAVRRADRHAARPARRRARSGTSGSPTSTSTSCSAREQIVEIASVQNNYNVGNRESEDDSGYCEANGIAFIPYFPLDGGDLPAMEALADRGGTHATIWQVALAWLLQHSPATLPIPGTSSLHHLEENAGAAKLSLSADEFELLEGYSTR